MGGVRFKSAVLAAAVVASFPFGSADAGGGPAVDASQAQAQWFRDKFGLAADPKTLAIAASSDEYSSEPYGVPLSRSEIAEMLRRVEVEHAVWDVAAYGASQPGWAGYYIDQHDQGKPVFLVTGDADRLGVDLAAKTPAGVDARVEVVGHSMKYLRDLQATIFADRDQLAKDGIVLTGLGTDVVGNRVEVSVVELDESVAKILSERYGDAVSFREEGVAVADTCTSTTNCRPIKGGLQIHNSTEPAAANICTSGFVIRRYRDGAWPLALLTAGHCIAGHPVNTPWEHNDSFLGNSKWQTWGSKSVAGQVRESDVGVIEIDNRSGNIPTIDNQMYVYNGSVNVLSVVTSIPTVNQTVGSQVCSYGSKSNQSQCGSTIQRINKQHTSTAWDVTHWINNTIEYDWNLIEGDSGGPIYQQWGSGTRAALGTHVHSQPGGGSTGYGWYTPIDVGRADYANVTSADGHADSFYLCKDGNC